MRTSAAMSKKGSERVAWKECSSAGVISGSLVCGPIVQSWELNDTTPLEATKDEAGNSYYSTGDREVTGKIVFLQRDKDTLLLGETYRDKYVTAVKEMTATALNGVYQYAVIPIMQFQPDIKIAAPAESQEVPIKVQVCSTAVAVDLTSYTGFQIALTCAAFTIPSGSYFGIYTQASS